MQYFTCMSLTILVSACHLIVVTNTAILKYHFDYFFDDFMLRLSASLKNFMIKRRKLMLCIDTKSVSLALNQQLFC